MEGPHTGQSQQWKCRLPGAGEELTIPIPMKLKWDQRMQLRALPSHALFRCKSVFGPGLFADGACEGQGSHDDTGQVSMDKTEKGATAKIRDHGLGCVIRLDLYRGLHLYLPREHGDSDPAECSA